MRSRRISTVLFVLAHSVFLFRVLNTTWLDMYATHIRKTASDGTANLLYWILVS